MRRKNTFRRACAALRRWHLRTTRSPRIGLLGLLVSILLVAFDLADLGRQLFAVFF